MDALIVLLVLGGLIVSLIRKVSGKSAKSANARKAVPDAAPPQEKIPFTKEEWARYLAAQGIAQRTAPAAKPAPRASTAQGSNAAPRAPAVQGNNPMPRASTAQGISRTPVTEDVSIEGESEAEHAGHMYRIAAAESEARARVETARELRRVSREHLRAAIVTREILDPPVSMRDE